MVSAWRVAWWRETVLVYQLPKKILSTATAEPGHWISRCRKKKKKQWNPSPLPGIHKISQVRQNRLGNWDCQPIHHWIWLHRFKSSAVNDRNLTQCWWLDTILTEMDFTDIWAALKPVSWAAFRAAQISQDLLLIFLSVGRRPTSSWHDLPTQIFSWFYKFYLPR